MSVERTRIPGATFHWLAGGVLCLTLTACGGSSGDNSGNNNDATGNDTETTVTLQGTAATGAAFVGTVTVVDQDGDVHGPVSLTSGDYSITVPDEPPFLLQALGTDGSTALYSWAGQGNVTVNITELTTLALVESLEGQGATLASLYADWEASSASITQDEIDQARAAINQSLETFLQAAGIDTSAYDFFSEPFEPNGEGIDAVMDQIEVSVEGNTATVTNALTGESIDISVDVGINPGGGVSDVTVPEGSVWTLSASYYNPQTQTVETISADMLSEYATQPPITQAEASTMFNEVSASITGDATTGLSYEYDVTYELTLDGDLTQLGDRIIWNVTGEVMISQGTLTLDYPVETTYTWTRVE